MPGVAICDPKCLGSEKGKFCTWTVLTGKGKYYLDQTGTTKPIGAGDVVVAPVGCVHGVLNNGDEPFVFISVVSPANAGYQPVLLEHSMTLNS